LKTVAALPESYSGTLTVTIDDHEPHITARNVILCILAASASNVNEASECIVHVWYSAFLRRSDLELLNVHVLPLVQEVCSKFEDESSDSLHLKTWQAGKCSIRLGMTKEAWQLLLSCLKLCPELTLEQAQALRLAAINDPKDQDIRELITLTKLSNHRVSVQRFKEDGNMLPFGDSRKAFVVPNP